MNSRSSIKNHKVIHDHKENTLDKLIYTIGAVAMAGMLVLAISFISNCISNHYAVYHDYVC